MDNIPVTYRTCKKPESHAYLIVMDDGEVIWNTPRVSMMALHKANFVVVKEDDGTLVVMKDRFGSQGRVVNDSFAGIRAAQHLGWIKACGTCSTDADVLAERLYAGRYA